MKKNKLYACLLTMALCFSLCACGSSTAETKSEQESQISTEVESTQETIQETTPEVATIDFTLDNRNIKYVGIEKANDELVDEENVYLVIFDFTNNDNVPEMCQQTFWIQYFQNGTECNTSLTRSSNGGEQYDMADKYFDEAMQGGTIRFAQLVQIEDNSPLTIMVSRNGGSEYQMMELDIESALNAGMTDIIETEAVEEVSEEELYKMTEADGETLAKVQNAINGYRWDFYVNSTSYCIEFFEPDYFELSALGMTNSGTYRVTNGYVIITYDSNDYSVEIPYEFGPDDIELDVITAFDVSK